jgi:predicted O-methyltransferase YrrM
MSIPDSAVGQRMDDPLKVYFNDDPNPEKAGLGLALAPFIYQDLPVKHSLYWMMSPAEQVALSFLLDRLRPKVAIEIGTRFGGSLQVISQYAERVYSHLTSTLTCRSASKGFSPMWNT